MRKEYTFAVLWTVVTLVLLSLFPEKKTRYLLPLLIPAAMVVAHYIVYIFTAAKEKTLTTSDRVVFRVNAFYPGIDRFRNAGCRLSSILPGRRSRVDPFDYCFDPVPCCRLFNFSRVG